MSQKRKIVVAITGASGAPYAKRLLEWLTHRVKTVGDVEVGVCLSATAAEVWQLECGGDLREAIDLPIYGCITPKTVMAVSDDTLRVLASVTGTLSMGIQAARPESLRLFNRQFQDEEQVKAAFDRLTAFGIRVRVDLIVGLPVDDPIGDAIETIKLAQRVTEGKAFAAAFPLMLYPGTKLHEMSIADNVPLNQECEFEWHKGIGSIDFGQEIQRRIRALVKLATFFVKYQVEEYWMRALIELPIDDQASKALSESNYLESLIFHQGDSVRERFDEILANTQLSY